MCKPTEPSEQSSEAWWCVLADAVGAQPISPQHSCLHTEGFSSITWRAQGKWQAPEDKWHISNLQQLSNKFLRLYHCCWIYVRTLLHSLPRFPVSHSGNWFDNTPFLGFLPPLSHFPISRPMFPRNISQINYLNLISYLRICAWGNSTFCYFQRQKTKAQRRYVTSPKSHSW